MSFWKDFFEDKGKLNWSRSENLLRMEIPWHELYEQTNTDIHRINLHYEGPSIDYVTHMGEHTPPPPIPLIVVFGKKRDHWGRGGPKVAYSA